MPPHKPHSKRKMWFVWERHRGRDEGNRETNVLELAIDVAGLGNVGRPVMPRFGGAYQGDNAAVGQQRVVTLRAPLSVSKCALQSAASFPLFKHSIHHFWQCACGRKREGRTTGGCEDRKIEEGEKAGRETATCR